MRPVRVALISSGLGHVARGIEIWMQELGPWLARSAGIQVELWSGGDLPALGSAAGLALQSIPSDTHAPVMRRSMHGCSRGSSLVRRQSFEQRYLWEQRSVLLQALWGLWRHRIDVAYCGDPALGWDLKRFRRQHGAKVVFMNGMRLTPKWLRTYDGIHLLAPGYLEEARDLLGEEGSAPFFAVPHFVDTEQFCPPTSAERLEARRVWGLDASAQIWLTVGPVGTESRKRLDHVAIELAGSAHSQVLISAGGDEDGADLVRERAQGALGKRIRFLGRIDRGDLTSLYRAADGYVLGSLAEPFSIAILEALSSGLPVVHHPDPVMCWQTGAGGIPVSMEAKGALTAVFDRVALNRLELGEVGVAARRLALERYSPGEVAEELAGHLLRIGGRDNAKGAG